MRIQGRGGQTLREGSVRAISERTELAKTMPWVTYLPEGVPCTGFMGHTPLKAIYRMGDKPPVGLDNYTCKNVAHWQFKALEDSMAKSGDYCWPHLISRGLFVFGAETERTEKWIKEHSGREVQASDI